MDVEAIVSAMINPESGMFTRIINRLEKGDSHTAEVEQRVLDVEGKLAMLEGRVSDLAEQVAGLSSEMATVIGGSEELVKRMDQLHEQLEILAAKPKRSRAKKEPVAQEPVAQPVEPAEEAAPAKTVEPEVVDPTAPDYEPGLVPEKFGDVVLRAPLVHTLRNDIKVCTLPLVKKFNPELPVELIDFVAGLSEEEADAYCAKFPAE